MGFAKLFKNINVSSTFDEIRRPFQATSTAVEYETAFTEFRTCPGLVIGQCVIGPESLSMVDSRNGCIIHTKITKRTPQIRPHSGADPARGRRRLSRTPHPAANRRCVWSRLETSINLSLSRLSHISLFIFR
jgi:hypothetical protein